jgi:hypothetical protein
LGIYKPYRLITVGYNALRESAGWNPIHPEQAAASLAGSALVVAALDGEKTVGTARLV